MKTPPFSLRACPQRQADTFQLLTQRQVARLLVVSIRTIQRLHKNPKKNAFPKATYIGKSPRWPLSVIEAWVLAGGSVQPQRTSPAEKSA